MRSWIGLYALLRMIRDAEMTEFSRDGITAMLEVGQGCPDAGHVRRARTGRRTSTIPASSSGPG